jgi:5-methylcytosine-specific restriction endonuclease McrA
MWPEMPLDVDHEIPRAFGGHDGPLRWAHRRCNQLAGARLGGKMRSRAQKPTRRWIDRWA